MRLAFHGLVDETRKRIIQFMGKSKLKNRQKTAGGMTPPSG
jgi:hypothetical protein